MRCPLSKTTMKPSQGINPHVVNLRLDEAVAEVPTDDAAKLSYPRHVCLLLGGGRSVGLAALQPFRMDHFNPLSSGLNIDGFIFGHTAAILRMILRPGLFAQPFMTAHR